MEGNYHNNNDDAFASDGFDYDMSDAEEEEQEEAKEQKQQQQEQATYQLYYIYQSSCCLQLVLNIGEDESLQHATKDACYHGQSQSSFSNSAFPIEGT